MARRNHVEGLSDLNRALGELSKATAANVLKRVAVKNLEPVAEVMRENAPEGMKDEILVTTKRPTGGAKEAKKSTVEAFAGPARSRKSHLVEFGTAPHVIRARATNVGGKMVFYVDGRRVATAIVNHPGAAPQPYARPAWDEVSPSIPRQVGADLFDEIKKTSDRIAKRQGRHDTRSSKG